MTHTSRRTVAVVIAGTLALAATASGCGEGSIPAKALPTQLADGVNVSTHQVDVRNLFVLGPLPNQAIPIGGSTPVYMWMVDNGTADRLVSVKAPGSARSVQLPEGGIALPPNRLVDTKRSTDGTLTPTVILRGLTKRLSGIGKVRLVLNFEKSGSITVDAPVVVRQGAYATYPPAPSATPSTPASATPTGSASPTPSGAPTPATSPTA